MPEEYESSAIAEVVINKIKALIEVNVSNSEVGNIATVTVTEADIIEKTGDERTKEESEPSVVGGVLNKENKNEGEPHENDSDSSASEDDNPATGTYIVEKILKKKMVDSEWKYLIKWQGWPSYTNTYEPKRNLVGCDKKLNEFEEMWEAKQNRKRERALREETENMAKKEKEDQHHVKIAKVEPQPEQPSAQGLPAAKPKAKKRRRRY